MPDRIFVYGVTGSGKTTLAAAERTGLPWHSVDDLAWEPDWTQVARDEQRRRITEVCAAERAGQFRAGNFAAQGNPSMAGHDGVCWWCNKFCLIIRCGGLLASIYVGHAVSAYVAWYE